MLYSDTATSGQAETQGAITTREVADARRWFLDQVARARKVGQFTVKATLTPALARALLDHHMPDGSNRRLRALKVASLAHTIRAGRWNGNTHQGIAFTTDAIVNDGQHRINAVAQAGIAVELPMTFGQPRSTFEVIDQAITPRGAADLLSLDGLAVNRDTTAAAAARGVLVVRSVYAGINATQAARASTVHDVLELARNETHRLRDAVNIGRNVANGLKAKVSPANLATAFFLILERAERVSDVEVFADALRTGANLTSSAPILVCREGLRTGEFGKHLRTATDRRLHEIAAVVNAWNLWRSGRSIKTRQPLSIADGNKMPKVAR